MTSSTIGSALRRILTLFGVLALTLAGVAVSTEQAQAASNVQVFVGYADTLRASPANFPTPWDGSPSTVFLGCHSGCSFDAGAARVVNNSPVAVTIDSVKVKLSTCTFDMWAHGTVLAPGAQLIITQTATGAADGCNNAGGFFDTSDIGPNGVGWSGHCDQSGVTPEVDVSVDGTVTAFQDTGQVLNTGGVDKAVCPGGGNESTQWTSIGSLPCPGATLTLAPSTQTVTPGDTATVKATLANTCGVGLSGAAVSFTVSAGPNAGQTGTTTTDGSGVATFQYPGAVPGTDTVGAATSNPAGTITSNTVSVVWQQRQSHLVLGGAGAGDFNDPATVSATLTDPSGPLASQSVSFKLNSSETCTGTTNASGVASCTLTPHEAAGVYPLVASFAGNPADLASSATGAFTVNLEETTLAYTGDTATANGKTATLSGVLKEDGATPIAGRTVAFTLGTGASAQTCSGTTDPAGAASCVIAPVNQPPATTSAPVKATFAGDTYYKPASASASLRFTYLTGRAYGLAASGLVNISATPDTGAVQTASAGTVAPPCVATLSGLISAHTLCAKVVTAVNPDTSTATASVQDATIGVLGLPVIKIGLVQSSSMSTCSAATGDAIVTSISVGGIPLNVNLHPGPNTRIDVAGITLILNEQTPVAGASQGLTVNAVHVKALGLLDTTIASATSDIHNC